MRCAPVMSNWTLRLSRPCNGGGPDGGTIVVCMSKRRKELMKSAKIGSWSHMCVNRSQDEEDDVEHGALGAEDDGDDAFASCSHAEEDAEDRIMMSMAPLPPLPS
jgi:hypothetical protein